MPFELTEAPWHPLYGYVSPHLPLGTSEPDIEAECAEEAGDVPEVFEWNVAESGDAHEFSEVVEVEHDEPVAEKTKPHRAVKSSGQKVAEALFADKSEDDEEAE